MHEVPNWKAVGFAELLAWKDGVHANRAFHGGAARELDTAT